MDEGEEENSRHWECRFKHQPVFESTASRRGLGPGSGAQLGKGQEVKIEGVKYQYGSSSVATDPLQALVPLQKDNNSKDKPIKRLLLVSKEMVAWVKVAA